MNIDVDVDVYVDVDVEVDDGMLMWMAGCWFEWWMMR